MCVPIKNLRPAKFIEMGLGRAPKIENDDSSIVHIGKEYVAKVVDVKGPRVLQVIFTDEDRIFLCDICVLGYEAPDIRPTEEYDPEGYYDFLHGKVYEELYDKYVVLKCGKWKTYANRTRYYLECKVYKVETRRITQRVKKGINFAKWLTNLELAEKPASIKKVSQQLAERGRSPDLPVTRESGGARSEGVSAETRSAYDGSQRASISYSSRIQSRDRSRASSSSDERPAISASAEALLSSEAKVKPREAKKIRKREKKRQKKEKRLSKSIEKERKKRGDDYGRGDEYSEKRGDEHNNREPGPLLPPSGIVMSKSPQYSNLTSDRPGTASESSVEIGEIYDDPQPKHNTQMGTPIAYIEPLGEPPAVPDDDEDGALSPDSQRRFDRHRGTLAGAPGKQLSIRLSDRHTKAQRRVSWSEKELEVHKPTPPHPTPPQALARRGSGEYTQIPRANSATFTARPRSGGVSIAQFLEGERQDAPRDYTVRHSRSRSFSESDEDTGQRHSHYDAMPSQFS